MTANEMLQNHIRRWNRQWRNVAIALALIITVISTVAFCINDFTWAYLLAGLVGGAGIAATTLILSQLVLFLFVQKIRVQEKRFSLSFSDENETVIEPRMGNRTQGGNPECHLSENWFFSPGLFAYCKPYIQTLTYTLERNAHNKPYYEVRILTVDDTCHTRSFSTEEDAKRILDWYNTR